MTVSELFKDEPYLYDLIYEPREDPSIEEMEMIVARHPNDVIYGLVQRIKELEIQVGERLPYEYDMESEVM